MFLKISEFKKAMKSALKTSSGLVIGNVKGHFLVHASLWGVWVESIYATSKFKAAIVELIGDMPEEETCYRYHLEEKTLKMEYQASYEDPYDKWKEAKDFACEIPLVFYSSPHELAVYQINSDRSYVTVLQSYAAGMMSPAELEAGMERMPGRPSVSPAGSTLYFKSDTMIYWTSIIKVSKKAEDTIFRYLRGLDFFEKDWLPKEEEQETGEDEAAEALPY